jgi:hypothetical protein
VVIEHELIARVDAAFAVTGHGLAGWPDPHPDRSPCDEEYSRLSDPAKWRIVGARADAWLMTLVQTGLAVVDHGAQVQWRVPPTTVVSRTDRVVPYVSGALPLVVARSQLGAVDDAGVTLGVGDPAVCVTWIPDCGCDACDSGSQDVLDELDEYVFGVVSGAFRRLWSGDREITVISSERWGASQRNVHYSDVGAWTSGSTATRLGKFGRKEVDAILADPGGWQEISGAPWMSDG